MRIYVVAASLAAVLPHYLYAQTSSSDSDSEKIVVTANRTPTEVEKIPAGITVIDRKTIETRGYTSLVDALSAVAGLRIVQSGGPGSVSSVFIRGTNSNQVLVLRDGVPINDPGDPGGAFNFGVDSLQDVERIEIVRGPMSSLYGSGAIGGVINLITRRASGALHGDLTLAAGLPRQELSQGHVAGAAGIWDFSASLEQQSLRGFDQTPQRETGVYTGETDGERGKLAQTEIGITPVAGTRISLLLRARDAKYGYDEGGVASAFDAGNATGYDASLFGRLGVTNSLAGGAWNSTVLLTRIQNDRRYTVTYEPSDPNKDQEDSRYHGRRTDAQWNNIVQLPGLSWATANQISFGYEHVADQADEKSATSSLYGPYDSAVAAHSDSDAGFLGAQTSLWQHLALTGQVREDAVSTAGDAFTWRIGGVLDLPQIASHLKASYGTSFRAPSLNDLYGISNFGAVGNPLLRPERGQGMEFGFTTDLPEMAGPAAGSFTLTYFDNRVRDLFEYIGLNGIPINVATARMHGVETILTWPVSSWLQADLGYTYTDARNLTTETQLLRRPFDQASVNLRITPIRSVTIAPELLYVGRFQDYLTHNDGTFGATGPSPSGVIVNFDITWQATPSVRLFVWGKNIGGSRFEPANGYQTPGASFLAGTRLAF